MTISISYHLPNGIALDSSRVDECTADVSLSEIPVSALSNVLSELSELHAREFPRIAALSAFKRNDDREDKDVESFFKDFCSPHSGLSEMS